MNWFTRWLKGEGEPRHVRIGRTGEEFARRHLERAGLRFLAANYRHGRGEIDLVFRDGPTLVFVEVKSRSSEDWVRPAAAVNRDKQRILSDTALAYLDELGRPRVPFRFDIVEVLFDGDALREVRHIPDAFQLTAPRMYR